MPNAIAIEIDYHDGTSVKTRYVTDVASFVTTPTDTPANIAFLPRLAGQSAYSINAVADAATFGISEAGFGQIELSNNDGALDAWINDGFAGRRIVIRRGDVAAAYPSGWSTIFTGVQAVVEVGYKRLTITFGDRQANLRKPLQTSFYGGTNALPNGVDGVADIKGKPRPRVYGRCKKVAPVLVNTSALIYEASDKQAVINAVADGGGVLVAGAAYTSQAQMESTAPAASQYRVWAPVGGPTYFRLGSSPAKVITCDVDAAGGTAAFTCAQVLRAIALDAGFAAGEISASDVTALDAASAAVCGVYMDGTQSALDLMNFVAGSIGACFWVDALGVLRMFRIVAPSGLPVTTLTKVELGQVDSIATRDQGRGVPAWRVEVNYQRYFRVQSTTETIGAAESIRADLMQEYRRVSSEDATVKTRHTNSPTLQFITALDSQSDAQAEADRRLTLYKANRIMLKCDCRLQSAVLAACVPGAIVSLLLPRFGCDAGKLFMVLGAVVDLRQNRAELTLWG
jgi:hypothetical protein